HIKERKRKKKEAKGVLPISVQQRDSLLEGRFRTIKPLDRPEICRLGFILLWLRFDRWDHRYDLWFIEENRWTEGLRYCFSVAGQQIRDQDQK
ncbi:unnamed protein product, partial [Linum tenue]